MTSRPAIFQGQPNAGGAQSDACYSKGSSFVFSVLAVVVPKPSSLPRPAKPDPDPKAESEVQPSDQAIANGVAEGMEWAADALYGRVQSVVDQSLRRILRSTGPDYDDLLQAAFQRTIT